MSKSDIKFEEALKRLEEIVVKLEKGDLPLEKSLSLFEEGVNLSRFCVSKLEEVKRRVDILIKSEDGNFSNKRFEIEEPDDKE